MDKKRLLVIGCRLVTSVWKTVPSEARVTRDEVSGFSNIAGRLSGRQYQMKLVVLLLNEECSK